MNLLPLSLVLLVASGLALADDGQRLVRSVSSAPGVSFVTEPEGEHAYMRHYVATAHDPQGGGGENFPLNL